MCKFESSQKDESRAQSTDSWKNYRKPRTFNCHHKVIEHSDPTCCFLVLLTCSAQWQGFEERHSISVFSLLIVLPV